MAWRVVTQILMVVSLIALSVLIWRVGKRPGLRMRAIIYGWAGIFVWALVWSVLLPGWLRGKMETKAIYETFPGGTWAAGMLIGGWVWPALLVELAINRERRLQKGDGGAA